MAKSNRTYQYSPPSYDTTVDRAERKGSVFDLMFKDAKLYRPKQGANLLRILPPGWPKASHYGLTVMVHRGVGPNDRQYLCLRENPSSPHRRCPVCEELYNLGAKATQEDRMALRARPSVAYYVIDRDNEKDGVQIWLTSPTTDSEIAAQSINRRTKSVIDIVHPDEGYDIEFTRTGAGRNNTRYRGFQVMREPCPLSDSGRRADEWLDVVFDHPLPSLLQFYSPDHIEEVFYGKVKEDVETEERTRARDLPDDREERPLRRTRVVDDDDEEWPRGHRDNRSGEDQDTGDDRLSRRSADRSGSDPDYKETERPVRRSRARDDDEDETPASRRRVASEPEPEPERLSRRSRPRDDEDDEPARPARSRTRQRDDDDEADRTEREEPRSRTRASRDGGDDDERPWSRLSVELDDEVPGEGGRRARPNGRDVDDEDEQPARSRRRPAEDDEEANLTARRERVRAHLDRE